MMRNNDMAMESSIQELELELALLKRKRMMVEQQQQMLNSNQSRRERPFDFNYDKPREMYNQPEQQRGFNASHSPWENAFDKPGSSNIGRQFGKKRQAANDDWNQNSPSKRFSGNQRGTKSKQYGSRSNPRPVSSPWERDNIDPQPYVSPKPLFKTPKPQKPEPRRPPLREDFKPRRSKKSSNYPNKLNSYPITERKKIVAEASKLTKKANTDDSNLILRADQAPSNQMSGRLELALGKVVGELRNDYGKEDEYEDIFAEPILRVIKQTVRERLRCAMLDKVVGNLKEILAHYRDMFPKDTDKEILEIAGKVAKMLKKDKFKIKLERADLPQEYFKTNMSRLLEVQLEEIFAKLKQMCEEEDKNDGITMQDVINEQIANLEKRLNGLGKQEVEGLSNVKDEKMETNTAVNVDEKTEYDVKENVDGVNEKTTDDVKENSTHDVAEISTTDLKENTADDTKQNSADNLKENTTNSSNNIEPCLEEKQEQNKGASDGSKDDIELRKTFKAWKFFNETYFKPDYYEKLMMLSIDRKLRNTLATDKYKQMILNLLDVDKMYKVTKLEILNQTRNRVRATNKVDASKANADGDVPSTKPKAYYVKVFGRPRLPERSVMKEFLDQFNPVYIKKHRSSGNLLFVTLGDEEDFKNMLAANGHRIGDNITLTIAVSDGTRIPPRGKLNKTEDKTNDSESKNDSLIDSSIMETTADNKTLETKSDDKNESMSDGGITNTASKLEAVIEIDDDKEPDNTDNAGDDAILTEIESEKVEENNEMLTDKDAEEVTIIEDDAKTVSKGDQIANLQGEEACQPGTPTRSSARLATSTPSAIRTRRSSRMAQN